MNFYRHLFACFLFLSLTACDRSCTVYPWIVHNWISEEEIDQWVSEDGEFIGSCEVACREPSYEGTSDTCEMLSLHDRNGNEASSLEGMGGYPGNLPGMGGFAGEYRSNYWRVKVKCGSGEREYCPIEE